MPEPTPVLDKDLDDLFEQENKEEKQEEKKEITEDKKDLEKEKEEEIVLKREPKKGKETKDESVANLRKQRDEARLSAKAFTETFGETKPEVIKPLLELASEIVDGPITVESITTFISELKSKDETINELKKTIEGQERKIDDLDVRYSPTFEKQYKKPYEDAGQNLFLEFATVDEDKKIIGPKSTKSFNDYLLGLENIDGVEIKANLQKFVKSFKEETGEDPSIPTMNSLMSSVRSFHKAKADMQEAYSNWKNKKKHSQEQSIIETEKEREVINQRNARERKRLLSKAYQEFDFDEYDFVDEKEAESLFREEFAMGEKLMKGEDVPSYDKMIERGVKARLFDKFASRIKELIELEKSVEKGERNHIAGAGKGKNETRQPTKDWLEDN